MAKKGKTDKRVFTRLLALILCALLAGSAVIAALISLINPAWAAAAEHKTGATKLTLTVDDRVGGVYALQETKYVNQTGYPLRQVLFDVGANALRRPGTAPVKGTEQNDAYPAGFAPGGVEFISVEVNGARASWGVTGEAESFMRVDCDIAPGESALFRFQYEVMLPAARTVLGMGEVGWRLAFFYPQPVRLNGETGQFEAVPLHGFGYAPAFDGQDFSVTIDAPATYAVACPGIVGVEKTEGNRARTTVALSGARLFACALSRRYTRFDTAEVQVYGIDHGTSGAVERAASLFWVRLTGLYGDIGRDVVIAEADVEAGIEVWDGLILMDSAVFADAAARERVLSYALARQWFSVAVGVRATEEPWLMEGICGYMMLRVFEERYGEARYLEELNRLSLDALNMTVPGGVTVDSPLSWFANAAEYEAVTRGRGAAVFHELRLVMGTEALDAALRALVQRFQGGVMTKEDLIAALSEAALRDMGPLTRDLLASMGGDTGQAREWYE